MEYTPENKRRLVHLKMMVFKFGISKLPFGENPHFQVNQPFGTWGVYNVKYSHFLRSLGSLENHRRIRHIWVKLCAEQLCGFCTSRSPIGCGKLPLQLVISLFDMPPLYLYIIIPFTRIESKIAQWQNQSAKLATTKHITHLTMQKTHMHGAKESHLFYTWNETANAHSQVRKSLTKQDRFKMHQKYCQCTRCSETSQPLWKEVSIAVQPEWLLDPCDSTRCL